eukprot:scaffold7611_cov183-Amphora_coffeaeformis.AAC.2
MEQEMEVSPPEYPDVHIIGNNASFASAESMSTKKTTKGKKRATAHEQAVLLSAATSQATAAARSILLSGGTQETALSTARAAAESVLLPNSAEKFSVFSSKRQAKQQAQVISSMALLQALSYTTSNASGTNIFMQTPTKPAPVPPAVISSQNSTSRRVDEISSVGNSDSFDGNFVGKTNSGSSRAVVPRSNQGLPPRPSPLKTSPKTRNSPKEKAQTERQSPKKPAPRRKNAISRETSKQKDTERNSLQLVASSGSGNSSFAKRRARVVVKKRIRVNTSDVPEDDLAYESGHPEELAEEASTFDTEDHSVDTEDHSAFYTEEEYEEEVKNRKSSDDAFDDLQAHKKERPVVNFGTMIVDGMLCGGCSGPNHKPEDRDDMSGDHQSNYSRHTDESSRDGNEDMRSLKEQSTPSPSRRFGRGSWISNSPRAQKKTKSNKNDTQ